jgi:hypothetical protein
MRHRVFWLETLGEGFFEASQRLLAAGVCGTNAKLRRLV